MADNDIKTPPAPGIGTDVPALPSDEALQPDRVGATPAEGVVDPGVAGDHVAATPPPAPDTGIAAPPTAALAVRLHADAPRAAAPDSGEYSVPSPTLPESIKTEIAARTSDLSFLHDSISKEGQPVTDQHIRFVMKTIHETIALFPKEFDPFDDTSEFREIAGENVIRNFFTTALENLLDIVNAAHQWTGIQLFARKMTLVARSNYGRQANRLFGLTTEILALTSEVRRYKPLYQIDSEGRPKLRPEERTFEDERHYFLGIERNLLPDPGYRSSLARELFYLGRGNPEIESSILTDLYGLFQEGGERRVGVIRLLNDLIPISESFETGDSLAVRDFRHIAGTAEPFYLLTTSTIFPPDQWTQVAVEGFRGLSGKTAEIGTGSGILSILVARNSITALVHGYDVNPQSPLVAALNAALASHDAEGRPLDGNPLHRRVDFRLTPDLLAGAPPREDYDVFFGCIPQVPYSGQITDRLSADVYPRTGYPEDIDGFGLLARALEQSRSRGLGRSPVRLIVSGRPGFAAVQQMALRRGFVPRVVHTRRISQEKESTDLSDLAAMEENGLRPDFEFYLGDRKINARRAHNITRHYRAWNLRAKPQYRIAPDDPDHNVTHDLHVIEFTPLEVMAERERWEEKGRQAMLAYLKQEARIGYTEDTGSEYEPFRAEMARHLSALVGLRIPEEAIFVGPDRASLVHNLMLASGRPVETINLQTTPTDFLDHFQENCRVGRLTLFMAGPSDVNRLHDLTRFLEKRPDAKGFAAIMWENRDLPVEEISLATMVLFNQALYHAMEKIGEDTYSRIANLEAVYETQLLITRRQAGFPVDVSVMKGELAPVEGHAKDDLSPMAQRLGEYKAHPGKLGQTLAPSVIDMSFGESEFPIPEPLLGRLVRSLSEMATEEEVREKITRYLEATQRGHFPGEEVVMGAGVHPLLERTMAFLGSGGKDFRVLIPWGSYGQFYPTVHVAGGLAGVVSLDPWSTDREAVRAELERAFGGEAPVLAFLLSYPTNPGGHYYSREALEEIARFCVEKKIFILADEIFQGTGDERDQTTIFDFIDRIQGLENYLIGYSGLSKEFALGGARFGFMFSHNAPLTGAIEGTNVTPIPQSALRLANGAYRSDVRQPLFEEHQKWLAKKRRELGDFLAPYNARGFIKYHEGKGGFFLEVDVAHLFGKTASIGGENYSIDEEGRNLREILHRTVGIKIAPVGWSGRPTAIRLVYSIENLSEGLRWLRKFLDAFENREGTGEVAGAAPTPSLGGVVAVTTSQGETTGGDDPNATRMSGGLRMFDGNAALSVIPATSEDRELSSRPRTSTRQAGIQFTVSENGSPPLTVARGGDDIRSALIRYATQKGLKDVAAFLAQLNDWQVRRLVGALGSHPHGSTGSPCPSPDTLSLSKGHSRVDRLLVSIATRIGAKEDLARIVPSATTNLPAGLPAGLSGLTSTATMARSPIPVLR